MFTALKKLVGSDASVGRDKNIPAGLQSMNQTLQRRFAKGVQYNMKIVIRGDRNTGKTTLWHRLQGKKFVEEYIPTQEIQVTSIHWNYKTTDDIVKVEVWDVVDKGKCKKRGESSLKLENDPQEDADMALDAEFLDVYKNCNGVIMMFDITKQWTFTYIMRELPKVPSDVPVCVLGNYRDMGEHRVILPDDVRECIQNLNRRPGSSYIRYAESSMKNSFGLKYLHKFFNIPFLQLQRETLLRQLETNQLDIDATLEELSVQQETEDQNYEIFLEMLETNKQQASPVATNGQSPASGSQSPVMAMNSASPDCSSPGTPLQLPSVIPASPPLGASPPPPMPDLPESAASPNFSVTSPQTQAPPQKRGFISRLFGSATPETPPARTDSVSSAEQMGKVQSVEDFVPDESLDRSFLEDSGAHREQGRASPREQKDSDSDGEAPSTNPMVAAFQDDLDPDDRVGIKPSAALVVPSKNITLSSDEEGPNHTVLITADEDIDSEPETWKPQQKAVSQSRSQKNTPSDQLISGAAQSTGKATRGKPSTKEQSDSDQEEPIANQMLSFVIDDPDFDSEDSSRVPKRPDVLPALNHLSDSSSEDAAPSLPTEVTKPVPAFKARKDNDLFGLGFEEKGTKENNEEDKDSKGSKEKKKKKKKTVKETLSCQAPEEEKEAKKKSRHKKGKEKEDGKEDKKKKPKKKKDEFDELEAFLGGGAPSRPRSGEEYEEL
ncbi:rab-like protein 6 isoform X1 [Xenopus laevis]|uniref:Rab-like protein 6 isoform X1 n=1 Tax=Xenopus laevis TaxID=8355 RepID=A0A8J1LQ15_XENLA|nr:rab-like protein 6 isoform X1 [Xenopus laevis]